MDVGNGPAVSVGETVQEPVSVSPVPDELLFLEHAFNIGRAKELRPTIPIPFKKCFLSMVDEFSVDGGKMDSGM